MMRTVVCALLLVLFVSFVVGEDCTPSYNSSFVACRDLYPTTQACLEYVTCGNVGQETCGMNSCISCFVIIVVVVVVIIIRSYEHIRHALSCILLFVTDLLPFCGDVGTNATCDAYGSSYCCAGGNPPIFVGGACQCYDLAAVAPVCTTRETNQYQCRTTLPSSQACEEYATCGNVNQGTCGGIAPNIHTYIQTYIYHQNMHVFGHPCRKKPLGIVASGMSIAPHLISALSQVLDRAQYAAGSATTTVAPARPPHPSSYQARASATVTPL
eukprot:TRINITY_DN8016_c0_g1_i1.p1 TRINITY_DN8016_c0_g1~~TRINITY_DN8016_c0_g1_i1.p1  ORF type:complete len:270 (+),score=34.48 TRINITY_DN8016_c0_g1_i1:88-897(+)